MLQLGLGEIMITEGLKQGWSLFPVLFNSHLEQALNIRCRKAYQYNKSQYKEGMSIQ